MKLWLRHLKETNKAAVFSDGPQGAENMRFSKEKQRFSQRNHPAGVVKFSNCSVATGKFESSNRPHF